MSQPKRANSSKSAPDYISASTQRPCCMTPRSSRSPSPANKRVKLEPNDDLEPTENDKDLIMGEDTEDEDGLQCSICLQPTLDRAIIPTCSHEFCFDCIRLWSERSRECPLCKQAIGDYLIHDIRSNYDFRKHHLPPIHSSSPISSTNTLREETIRRRRQRAEERERHRERIRRRAEREEHDRLQESIVRRKWIYEHGLFAKHVGSNPYTRYRPFPTPAQFTASSDYIHRTTTFLRRELQIWNDLDVEFLTTFIISMMKSIDIRSESAIKLLSEFLDLDTSYTEGERQPFAEHFAHEVYSYLRSPFRDLFVYDEAVQYDTTGLRPPPIRRRRERWRNSSPSQSRAPPRAENHNRVTQPQSPASSPPHSEQSVQVNSQDDVPVRTRDAEGLNEVSMNIDSWAHDGSSNRERSLHIEDESADAINAGLRVRGDTTNNGTRVYSSHGRPHDDEVSSSHQQTAKHTSSQHSRQYSGLRETTDVEAHSRTPPSEEHNDHVQTGTSLNLGRVDRLKESDTRSSRKPPRTRNLIQSVHDHLGPGLGCRTELGLNNISSAQCLNLQQRDITSPRSTSLPSLLARLSDPAPESGAQQAGPSGIGCGPESVHLGDHPGTHRRNIDSPTDIAVPLTRTFCSPRKTSPDLQARPNDVPAASLSFDVSSNKGALNSSPPPTNFLRDPRKNPLPTNTSPSSGSPQLTIGTLRLTEDHSNSSVGADSLARRSVTANSSTPEVQSDSRRQVANHEPEDPLGHVVGTMSWGNSIGPSSPLNSTGIISEHEPRDVNERRAILLSKLLHEKRQGSSLAMKCDDEDEISRVEPPRSRVAVNLGPDTELLTESVKPGNLINSTSSDCNTAFNNAHQREAELGKEVRLKAKLAMEKRNLEQ